MVVLNKADVCPDIPPAVDRVAAVAPGVAIHVVSALSGSGLEALGDAFLDSRTVALLGSSGVGKSSLINLLVGREAQRVHDVRDDGKGRHTTTRRELILRPEGGLVIDTPGMRELQLWEGGEGVPAAFAEVEDFAAQCRFTDCSHEAEPGCAVLEAVADGTLRRTPRELPEAPRRGPPPRSPPGSARPRRLEAARQGPQPCPLQTARPEASW